MNNDCEGDVSGHASVIIIGAGPAGYTAAIYAARALLRPVLICGHEPGGQLLKTENVENYPGFADLIQGPWLMEQMRLQAHKVGARFVNEIVDSVDLKQRPFRIHLSGGDTWTCDALILATGAQARWLGLPSEARFKGFGVTACAICDGFFFEGLDVVVVGGGNTAMEDALTLSHLARHVTVVHRRAEFRAERMLQARLLARDNVTVMWNSIVIEVLGNNKQPESVGGVRLRNLIDSTETDLVADGLFVAIGHDPAVALVEDQLRLTPNGYIWTAPGTASTDVAGVFAAGDVADDKYRQAVTAAGTGCIAALEAERYVHAMGTQRQAAE